jgi:hypothetical protein
MSVANCIRRIGIGSALPPLEKGRVGVGIILSKAGL